MFQEPSASPYELRFQIFGFPIRVHPFFWLLCVLINGLETGGDMRLWLVRLLACAAALFVSVLVHELGHAFLMRRFYRTTPEILLYGFGGLAIPRYGYSRLPSPFQSIAISAAGPFTGFVLVVLIAAFLAVIGCKISVTIFFYAQYIPVPLIVMDKMFFAQMPETLGLLLNSFFFFSIFFSLFYGVINLLPIYPLDGGHIAREFCLLINRRTGIANSLWISLIVAGSLAAYELVQWAQVDGMQSVPFMGIFFATFAYQSFRALGVGSRL